MVTSMRKFCTETFVQSVFARERCWNDCRDYFAEPPLPHPDLQLEPLDWHCRVHYALQAAFFPRETRPGASRVPPTGRVHRSRRPHRRTATRRMNQPNR